MRVTELWRHLIWRCASSTSSSFWPWNTGTEAASVRSRNAMPARCWFCMASGPPQASRLGNGKSNVPRAHDCDAFGGDGVLARWLMCVASRVVIVTCPRHRACVSFWLLLAWIAGAAGDVVEATHEQNVLVLNWLRRFVHAWNGNRHCFYSRRGDASGYED